MKRNVLKVVMAFCLAGAVGVYAGGNSADVVTGGHVLSAMMQVDPLACRIDVNGSLNPEFKGSDTRVQLLCQSATSPFGDGAPRIVGSTSRCNLDNSDGCINTVDVCTGKFSMTIFPGFDGSGNCQLHVPAGQVCYFVANVTATNKQQCNGSSSNIGPDPSGTAPCGSNYCTP